MTKDYRAQKSCGTKSNTGEYSLKYMAPYKSSLLSISVYYGKQSTIGNVVLRSVGSSLMLL